MRLLVGLVIGGSVMYVLMEHKEYNRGKGCIAEVRAKVAKGVVAQKSLVICKNSTYESCVEYIIKAEYNDCLVGG